MGTNVYKSAMGRPVDMSTLMLAGEQTRAVGNMNVNARGDLLDSSNRVIESKPKQVQKQYQKQVAYTAPVLPATSARADKKQHAQKKAAIAKVATDTAKPVKIAATPIKEKIVNPAVLDVYNNERLVSKFDKMQKPLPQTVPSQLLDIDSMEELNEISSPITELIADPIVEVVSEVEVTSLASVPRGGLAAAIAKLKQ
jgi:hypothetical protein|tara:strand:- start:7894 stop:8487 length:594 start_codon:yes stop_codon:yes gene_type:complete